MGFVSLLMVASMPVLEVLLIGSVGAYLASAFSNVLHPAARRDINKVVFAAFTPSLMFASLARTVTLQDLISWWYMPINIGISFAAGGLLGWLACNVLKPPQHLRGLVIACCSAGNYGNLLLILVPAVCDQEGNPFEKVNGICRDRANSYASTSMALGGLFIWTHTYIVMQNAGKEFQRMQAAAKTAAEITSQVDEDAEGNNSSDSKENQLDLPLISNDKLKETGGFWGKLKESTHKLAEELMTPPNITAVTGFITGATPWLKSLVVGEEAPLKVVQNSLQLLGNGTIPCITLILGGNLTQGMKKSLARPSMIFAILCIRYVVLPVIGIAAVLAARNLGFLPQEPMYQYMLMMQFAVPTAMNVGTMSQLFNVGQEECSVIFFWLYIVAAIALTIWSTIFMSLL